MIIGYLDPWGIFVGDTYSNNRCASSVLPMYEEVDA